MWLTLHIGILSFSSFKTRSNSIYADYYKKQFVMGLWILLIFKRKKNDKGIKQIRHNIAKDKQSEKAYPRIS